MSGGADLLGAPIAPPRKRGRPKGSTNKRAKDLKGLLDARYGGSAAQHSAALCMVTPAELKAAGGSMAKAQVAKALDLVRHVRDAKDRLDGELRDLAREAVVEVLGDGFSPLALKTFIARIQHLGGDFGLAQAMKLLADERAALLPYTDQRQPLAVEKVGDGWRPDVVFMGAAPAAQLDGPSTDLAGEFRVIGREVSQLMSHAEGEAPDLLGLLDLGPAAGE